MFTVSIEVCLCVKNVTDGISNVRQEYCALSHCVVTRPNCTLQGSFDPFSVHLYYQREECFFHSRNISWFTPKFNYFRYLKKNAFWIKISQKLIYLIWKTEALNVSVFQDDLADVSVSYRSLIALCSQYCCCKNNIQSYMLDTFMQCILFHIIQIRVTLLIHQLKHQHWLQSSQDEGA